MRPAPDILLAVEDQSDVPFKMLDASGEVDTLRRWSEWRSVPAGTATIAELLKG